MIEPTRKVPAGRLAGFEVDDEDTTPQLPSLPPRRPQPAPIAAEPASPQPQPVKPPSSTGVDRVRPSNVHVPVGLIDQLETWCERHAMSHGEAIISSLEAVYPRLGDLINPAATAGGNLFTARRSHTVRNEGTGPRTPLNYRLRDSDFAKLDELVAQFGATSRGHLITVALTAYLNE